MMYKFQGIQNKTEMSQRSFQKQACALYFPIFFFLQKLNIFDLDNP